MAINYKKNFVKNKHFVIPLVDHQNSIIKLLFCEIIMLPLQWNIIVSLRAKGNNSSCIVYIITELYVFIYHCCQWAIFLETILKRKWRQPFSCNCITTTTTTIIIIPPIRFTAFSLTTTLVIIYDERRSTQTRYVVSPPFLFLFFIIGFHRKKGEI